MKLKILMFFDDDDLFVFSFKNDIMDINLFKIVIKLLVNNKEILEDFFLSLVMNGSKLDKIENEKLIKSKEFLLFFGEDEDLFIVILFFKIDNVVKKILSIIISKKIIFKVIFVFDVSIVIWLFNFLFL